MSYITTVLSKNPVLFPYLADTPGTTVMTDYSVSAVNGVYHANAVLGLESPIETDPTGRAVGGRVGLVTGAPAPVNDFSWGGWGYASDDVNTHAGIVCRNGQAGLNHSNFLELGKAVGTGTQARVQCMVSIGAADGEHSFLLSIDCPALNQFYRALVTRIGSVLSLFMNGVLGDQRTDLPAGPITLPAFLSNTWKIGTEGNGGGVWNAVRTSAVDIYDRGLTAADELEIYESGRARLPMFVDFNMRTSMIVDLTPPTVYAAFPYSHDFASPAIERLIRLTEVVQAKDGTEERSGQSDKTKRRYSYDIPILDAHSRRRLKAFLRANQKQPVIWPITTDEDELSEAIAAGESVVIPVATQHMDYDVGGRAILGSETDYEAVEIEAMDADSITAKEVVNDWPIGTLIRPGKRAIVQQDLSLSSINEDTQDISITATILVEDIVAAPNRITPYTPTLYRGVERFNPFEFGLNDTSDASDDDSRMVSEVLDTGTGIFRVDTDQEFATEGIGYTFFLDGRELISAFLGWYEARTGRLNNLWVPTMVRDIGELVAISISTVTLSESYYETDYAGDPARSDLVLVGTDDTIGLRHINSVAPSGDNEVLTLSALAAPFTLSNTEFVCFLLMCRLEADEVELAWFTSDLLKATVKFREVPKEVV
jgi:hypothetical protein